MVAPLPMIERVAERLAHEEMAKRVALRFARGVMPTGDQLKPIQKVLADLDKAKIYLDFDMLSDLMARMSHSPYVSEGMADKAGDLAHRLEAIHRYMGTYVLDTMSELGDFISTESEEPKHERPRGVFAGQK